MAYGKPIDKQKLLAEKMAAMSDKELEQAIQSGSLGAPGSWQLEASKAALSERLEISRRRRESLMTRLAIYTLMIPVITLIAANTDTIASLFM
jgi:hypothetical protein